MLDITERGHNELKNLNIIPYYRLSRREKADFAILTHVWDERERAGGPTDDVDIYAVVNSLMKRNTLWNRLATRNLVEETIPKLLWCKLLERD